MKVERLFTLEDAKLLLLSAYIQGWKAGDARTGKGDWTPERCLNAYGGAPDNGSLTFPPDEPLFVLRGSDPSARGGLGGYFEQAVSALAGDDALASAEQIMREFEDWQREHPDRVKVPS